MTIKMIQRIPTLLPPSGLEYNAGARYAGTCNRRWIAGSTP
jgi:hypothetical protein